MPSSMTPMERYRQDLTREGFVHDPAQEDAVRHLQALYEALVASGSRRPGWLERLGERLGRRRQRVPERGLYFWGGVGRGKTYLMDTFFECLPFEDKLRAHFHRFMQRVHDELTRLSGEKNPLEKVADRLASEARVICFDEFFVSDIADAMILGELFRHLFSRGVSLVATSNIVPDQLYRNGLQRARFLPAIDLINTHTRVLNVDGGTDYRLRTLEQAELYHYPLDAAADQSLMRSFSALAPEPGCQGCQVEVNHRFLTSRWSADDVIWFDFSELCQTSRSQNDYIELARIYHAVLLSNVPRMEASLDDAARRFINMVDEFYDRNVKLVLSAEVPLEQLYGGERLAFEFERTRSRLLEMQSHEYLARPHKP